MISFTLNSLTFLPACPVRKDLQVTIKTGGGHSLSTKTFFYDPKVNFVKIGEKLDFLVNEPQHNMFFQIDMTYIDLMTNKQAILCTENVHLNKLLTTSDLHFKTVCGLTAKLNMFLEVSEEFTEYIPQKDPAKEIRREVTIEETFSTDGFSVAKMKYLYEAMVHGLTPIVQAKDAVVDFLDWKDPSKTFFFSVMFTFFLLHPRASIIIGLVLVYFFGKVLFFAHIRSTIGEDKKANKMDTHKKNMKFVKQLLRSHSISYDYYSRLFLSPDKTFLVQSIIKFKKTIPYIVPVLALVRIRYLIILAYWGALLYNTRMGEIFVLCSIKRFNRANFYFKSKKSINESQKLQSLKSSMSMKESTSNSPLSTASTDSTVRESVAKDAATRFSFSDVSAAVSPVDKMPKVLNEKLFVLYENQRWWLGSGWQEELLPGERPSWSDESGTVELTRGNVKLPSANWEWENEWNYVISSKTDADGWEYASRFSKFADPTRKPSVVNAVRRRKWVRKCIGYDA